MTQAEAAGAYLKREQVRLPELVDQVLKLNEAEFQSRAITVETRFGTGCGVSADRNKLLQVLRNLVENAWQYTPSGGAFRIAADRTADGVMLTFANSGATIANEDLPYIFERFYRGDKSRSRDSGGAGIGLSIVKELIEAHGGRVGAETGNGETRFLITLPAEAPLQNL